MRSEPAVQPDLVMPCFAAQKAEMKSKAQGYFSPAVSKQLENASAIGGVDLS